MVKASDCRFTPLCLCLSEDTLDNTCRELTDATEGHWNKPEHIIFKHEGMALL